MVRPKPYPTPARWEEEKQNGEGVEAPLTSTANHPALEICSRSMNPHYMVPWRLEGLKSKDRQNTQKD